MEAYAEFQVRTTCSLKVQKSQQSAAASQADLGNETTLEAVADVRMDLKVKAKLFLKACIMSWCIMATGWLSAQIFCLSHCVGSP